MPVASTTFARLPLATGERLSGGIPSSMAVFQNTDTQPRWKMQGYWPATQEWEIWESQGVQNPVPPSGRPLLFISSTRVPTPT